MLYNLLGRIVWNGVKLVLRTKYGQTYVPKPVLGVAAAATVAAILIALQKRSGD